MSRNFWPGQPYITFFMSLQYASTSVFMLLAQESWDGLAYVKQSKINLSSSLCMRMLAFLFFPGKEISIQKVGAAIVPNLFVRVDSTVITFVSSLHKLVFSRNKPIARCMSDELFQLYRKPVKSRFDLEYFKQGMIDYRGLKTRRR